jgi:hypothetical protein
MLLGGYVVAGHVPIEVIQRLLTERPNIIGISLPGMPWGAPGTGGPKRNQLLVYAFGKQGQSVFAAI